MLLKTSAAIAFLLIASSTSHAQNISPTSGITEYEFRQIMVAYVACLDKTYTENAKHISGKLEISKKTIESCKAKNDALKESFLRITKSPRELNELLLEGERHRISMLSKKYDEDSDALLRFSMTLFSIHQNCAMANRPFVWKLYDIMDELLVRNFAYYRNPKIMERAQIKYAKLIDIPLAKSAPEQWCQRVADTMQESDPDLKKQLFVE